MIDTTLQNEIAAWVDAQQDALIDLARALISYQSENRPPHGAEGPCQRYVADVMADIGCRVDMFNPLDVPGLAEHPAYWPGRDYTDRPNVVGALSPATAGPFGRDSGRPSLLFTGHIDVVPAIGEGQHGFWDGALSDGELYGRGSNDMKGGIAAFLTAARCLRELRVPLRGDLLLETVVDEEFGGANGTLACRLRGYNADLALLPEPNNMTLSPAHRGGQQFRLYTEARSIGMGFGADALPDPLTALGHALAALDRYNEARHARPLPPGFEHDRFPIMPFALRAGDLLPWGTAETIPETAWVEFWIETPPGVTQEQLQAELQAAVADAGRTIPALQRVGVRWEPRTRFLPGSQMPANHPGLRAVARHFESVTGHPPAIQPAPFACDGFMFNLLSPTPVALLGPRGANAHAPDERVVVADLVALAKIYALTAAEWLS